MNQQACGRLLAKGLLALVLITAVPVNGPCAGTSPEQSSIALKGELEAAYGGKTPREWGETVTGVKTRLETKDKVIALSLDACWSPKGKGFDAELVRFLEKEKIPATMFINARWIDANPDLFLELAQNPLFTIANHGLLHKPASVNGKSVYGISGTRDVGELVDEIELNAEKIEKLTGKRPAYYRSGTAYYDEIAVQVAERLGHQVIGFSVLGDAGATYSAQQVTAALLASTPGSIVILHMNHPESGAAEGVKTAVPELRKRGFRFVGLAEYPLK